jgi:hypothetical protein
VQGFIEEIENKKKSYSERKWIFLEFKALGLLSVLRGRKGQDLYYVKSANPTVFSEGLSSLAIHTVLKSRALSDTGCDGSLSDKQ